MNEIILSGEDLEMMGVGSFLKRQARKVSKVVRPLTHSALNLAAKVPVTSGFVSSARSAASILKSAPKKIVMVPDAVKPETPAAAGGSKIGWYLGGAALLGGGIFLATRNNSN